MGICKFLWTRDFCYMVEYAGDLMDPNEIKASIYYLLNGQREDGCIPDRVNAAGQPIYSPGPPGKPMADNALENGINECINDGYVKVPNFVVSATNVYTLTK